MLKRIALGDQRIERCFEIVKGNMIKLGVQVTEDDKVMWTNNLNELLKKEGFYLFAIEDGGEIKGFLEYIINNGRATLSEIQLDDSVKCTRTILKILDYLRKANELKPYNEMYFSIRKTNDMSNKTFSHLGGEKVGENERNNLYKITRESVNNWFKKLGL